MDAIRGRADNNQFSLSLRFLPLISLWFSSFFFGGRCKREEQQHSHLFCSAAAIFSDFTTTITADAAGRSQNHFSRPSLLFFNTSTVNFISRPAPQPRDVKKASSSQVFAPLAHDRLLDALVYAAKRRRDDVRDVDTPLLFTFAPHKRLFCPGKEEVGLLLSFFFST